MVEEWSNLPRRVYLDTSTLRDVWDYGGMIFDGEQFLRAHRDNRVDIEAELLALRWIFEVNERAHFELVVSSASLAEVHAWEDQGSFHQWVYDVLDVWLVQSEGELFEPSTHDASTIGSVSMKDARLVQDALDLGCDALLTMERKLPTQAEVIERRTTLRVFRPTGYWKLLSRFARLYS